MGRLFGTDGVRGKANVAPMDSDTVLRLGRAAAHVMRRSGGRHRILIGKDTRLSGYMLEQALASGISSMGVDVLLCGPLPTPGIAYMTRSMRADAGVVISASHNPYQDNGIKFFGPDGFKLADATEAEIERLMEPGHLDELRAVPELIGKAVRIDDALGRYIVYLKSCLPRDCKFDGLKIVLDTANGAAYRVAPQLYSELGADIITRGDKPDGTNINDGCGSMNPEGLSAFVRDRKAHCGAAFDGDADRVLLCDENGDLIDGDSILAILAGDFVAQGTIKGDGVVGTSMSNFGLEIAMRRLGLKLYRADVGDRYVLQEMLLRGLNLGGEQSGHVITLDHNTTGDGVLTSILVMSLLLRAGKPLSYYQSLVKRYPQKLLNVAVSKKPPLSEVPAVQGALKMAQEKLADTGRVIVRYSGTEPKVRVMVECEDENLCNQLSHELADTLRQSLG